MIKISKMTDYAIVLLAELAQGGLPTTTGRGLPQPARQEGGEKGPAKNLVADMAGEQPSPFLSASDLSALTFIPLPTVQLLLKKLTVGQFLLAERGRGGGYGLAKDLSAISVFDILLLMEGAPTLTACTDHHGDDQVNNKHDKELCDKIDHCHLTGRWQKINNIITSTLRDISLQDLLRDDDNFHQHFHQPPAPAAIV